MPENVFDQIRKEKAELEKKEREIAKSLLADRNNILLDFRKDALEIDKKAKVETGRLRSIKNKALAEIKAKIKEYGLKPAVNKLKRESSAKYIEDVEVEGVEETDGKD